MPIYIVTLREVNEGTRRGLVRLSRIQTSLAPNCYLLEPVMIEPNFNSVHEETRRMGGKVNNQRKEERFSQT